MPTAAATAELEALKAASSPPQSTTGLGRSLELSTLNAIVNPDTAFLDPVRVCQDKDIRVAVGWWQGEIRVDIREFYYHNCRTKKVSGTIGVEA